MNLWEGRFYCCKRSKYYVRSHKLWRKCLFLQFCHTGLVFCLLLFRDYINKLRPPVKGVPMKIRKLFRVIGISNEPVRTLNCVR